MTKTKVGILCLISLSLLLTFQNCTQIKSSDLSQANSTKSVGSDSNGGAYEGKPDRFYRFNADFTCEESWAAIGVLSFSNPPVLQLNSRNQCGSSITAIVPEDIDRSPLQNTVIGYGEGIYEYAAVAPSFAPDRIVEFWCKNSAQADTPEVIVRYNSADQKSYVQIFYPNASVPEFTVTQSQFPSGKEALINDSMGFRLFVNYDLPAMTYPGQIDANIEVFLGNEYLQKILYCRAGGRFDSLK